MSAVTTTTFTITYRRDLEDVAGTECLELNGDLIAFWRMVDLFTGGNTMNARPPLPRMPLVDNLVADVRVVP